jgi:enamine deaminase RidA (YjgF/YER057c/UK114 family)
LACEPLPLSPHPSVLIPLIAGDSHMRVEAKLHELGLELPPTPRPAANYVGAVQTGNLLFISGHGPTKDGKFIYLGKVGKDLSIEEGYEAARLVALNCLASAKSVIGDLDRITRVVKILGMVHCTEDFGDQPKVINGASDLLVQLFGDSGRHARSAVGMQALPFGMAVEIEMILEIE